MKTNKYTCKFSRIFSSSLCVIFLLSSSYSIAAGPGKHNKQINFTDIVLDDSSGINYHRTKSETDAIYDAIKQGGILLMEDAINIPGNSRGAPGIAIFDYDRDGDMDVYVTNGPGTPNSLFSNQLKENGELIFIDNAEEAGVTATLQDSRGVCYGDIDNDGDMDLLVLGDGSGNKLYENNADGTFVDISESSNLAGGVLHPSSCSMGDINNDGLLDIAIANSAPLENRLPLMTFDHDFLMEHNQIFKNSGNNSFEDVSAMSGIQNIARVTWAISLVDYDQDGDADLIVASDQGPRAPFKYGGEDKGYIRVYNNNGAGQFTDLTEELGTNQFGAWMGVTFGDVNHDGHMDMFATNTGDYAAVLTGPLFNFGPVVGEWHSSVFLGDASGGLTRQSLGKLVADPFGWGASMQDYDNDGDTDILYHGGLDVGVFMEGSNNGALLRNNGAGEFSRDKEAISNSTKHARRNVRGVAVGDLDNNGYVDFISVSNQNWPEQAPLIPYPVPPLNSPFDEDVFIWPTFSQVDPSDISQGFIWNGIEPEDGTLSIEINDGSNGNNWIKVGVAGSIGLINKASVNRSGIGAVVSFTPKKGIPAMWPVVGGSSYASQDSHEWVFGLGKQKKGTLDILWPGGVRNRLYNVHAEENILFPEIPCSYSDKSISFKEYSRCVRSSVHSLHAQGIVSKKLSSRLIHSALRAYKRSI
jgi:hypothetical protein